MKLLPKTMAKLSQKKSKWDIITDPFKAKRSLKKRLRRGKTVKLEDFQPFQINDTENVQQEKKEEPEEKEEEDNSCWGKFIHYYSIPVLFVQDLTMPAFEKERWNYYVSLVTPIFGGLFLIWQFGFIQDVYTSYIFWIIFGVITVPIMVAIAIKGKDPEVCTKYEGTLAAWSFVQSTLWINLVANIFMDFLSLIAVVSGLPINFLSLTMLAWGNSLGDFFVNFVISKNGQGMMAVTGTYGGQIFNLLCGFGGSVFRSSLSAAITPGVFDFGSDSSQNKVNILTIALLGTLLFSLISTLVIASKNKWTLGRGMLIFVLALYGGFLVAASVIALV